MLEKGWNATELTESTWPRSVCLGACRPATLQEARIRELRSEGGS